MRIAKTDPRLEAKGFHLYQIGNVAWLAGSDGKVCDVSVEGDSLVFFPDRSSKQKEFLKLLGETV